ncbi:MAG: inosine/xanthosine triphosphatase, partial [Gemmatimonadaceae bacterium]
AMPQSLLPWIRKVVVGSTNPVKIAAVRAVIARVAPDATVHSVAVASGVPDQPWGDEETQRGAAERARQALGHTDHDNADLGIGVEGGVVKQADGSVRTCAWAVAYTRDGRHGTGGSLCVQLPPEVAALVIAGTELGHAMDKVAKLVDTKRRTGAVGILTAGLIDRQRAYEPLITYSLAPFLAADYFERPVSVGKDAPVDSEVPDAGVASSDGR